MVYNVIPLSISADPTGVIRLWESFWFPPLSPQFWDSVVLGTRGGVGGFSEFAPPGWLLGISWKIRPHQTFKNLRKASKSQQKHTQKSPRTPKTQEKPAKASKSTYKNRRGRKKPKKTQEKAAKASKSTYKNHRGSKKPKKTQEKPAKANKSRSNTYYIIHV